MALCLNLLAAEIGKLGETLCLEGEDLEDQLCLLCIELGLLVELEEPEEQEVVQGEELHCMFVWQY